MSVPISVDIPHQFGREEARRRIAAGVGRMGDHIPGGIADLKTGWADDRMSLALTAMGQQVTGHIDVAEKTVTLELQVPGMLALFADKIREKLAKEGPKLLR